MPITDLCAGHRNTETLHRELTERIIGAAYRLDLLVEKVVIVEGKAVERLAGIHEAQMLTYLRHRGLRVGLILNFNTRVLPNGIQRISL